MDELKARKKEGHTKGEKWQINKLLSDEYIKRTKQRKSRTDRQFTCQIGDWIEKKYSKTDRLICV